MEHHKISFQCNYDGVQGHNTEDEDEGKFIWIGTKKLRIEPKDPQSVFEEYERKWQESQKFKEANDIIDQMLIERDGHIFIRENKVHQAMLMLEFNGKNLSYTMAILTGVDSEMSKKINSLDDASDEKFELFIESLNRTLSEQENSSRESQRRWDFIEGSGWEKALSFFYRSYH